jgi:hypothetical protein
VTLTHKLTKRFALLAASFIIHRSILDIGYLVYNYVPSINLLGGVIGIIGSTILCLAFVYLAYNIHTGVYK